MTFYQHKRQRLIFSIVFVVAILALCFIKLEVNPIKVVTNFSKAITYFSFEYFPIDFSELPTQLDALWKTILLAIAGSTTGMLLALISALMISIKTAVSSVLRYVLRIFASITRNIPEGIWAIILLLGFWFGDFLAYLVMSIVSYGFLVRVFADTIDETSTDSIEALKATGASYWQVIIHGVIPEVLPSIISWSLYSIENNIRSATIVGMLSGSGIGYLFGIYKGYGTYRLMMSAILLTALLVIATDQISTLIRRRILQ